MNKREQRDNSARTSHNTRHPSKGGKMNDSNYPDGVTSKDFDKKHSPVSVTVELTDLEYDNGYGDQQAELIIDCTVNGDEIEATDGMLFLIDQDGGVFKEIEYEYGEKKSLDEAIYDEAMRLAEKEAMKCQS